MMGELIPYLPYYLSKICTQKMSATINDNLGQFLLIELAILTSM